MTEYTAQQKALEEVRQLHGPTSFTEDHVGFRMVGYKVGIKTIAAAANTWREAMALLERKS